MSGDDLRALLPMPARWLWGSFILHNVEEAAGLVDWAAAQGVTRPWLTRESFELAVIGLLVLSALILQAGLNRVCGRGGGWILAILAGALLANALSHLVLSLASATVMPGLYTGLLLMGPAAAPLFLALHHFGLLSRRGIALCCLAGLALTPPLAAGSIRFADLLLGTV